MSYLNAHNDSDFCWLDEVSFSSSPADSIDYALMEKSDSPGLFDSLQDGNYPIVFPMNDIGWNDIGSWSSLWHILDENRGSEKTLKISNKTKEFSLKRHKITDKKDINRNKSDYFSTHWIVVKGGAKIISDKENFDMPSSSSLDQKFSDVVGESSFKLICVSIII